MGSLAEEARLLLGVLTDLARGGDGTAAGGDAQDGPGPRPGPAEGSGNGNGDGGSTGPGQHQCLGWCPVCRGADLARHVTPEVRAHLAQAGSSLLAAAVGLLAGQAGGQSGGQAGGQSGGQADPGHPEAPRTSPGDGDPTPAGHNAEGAGEGRADRAADPAPGHDPHDGAPLEEEQ
ncbi:hypothetical protein [Nocardioides bruguierae]|uniref:hypothetical protein n=1 Tax=Nocardioides bruguierae TaxID=2945102 RepID=UPI0020209BB6|nr:hypothetical protein [Nocardioides bruguierae]MCL8027032.1 hypothetical protein [Nocardioides bruguierae]